jgi:hypothetical protein
MQRQTQADQSVRRISDDGLIEIPNLDFNMFRRIGDGVEIGEVQFAANPDRRSVRKRSDL